MITFNSLTEVSNYLDVQVEALKSINLGDIQNYKIDHYEVSENTGTLWAICYREMGGFLIWKDFEITTMEMS